jgi:transposase
MPLLDAEHGQRIVAMVCGPPPAGRARYPHARTIHLVLDNLNTQGRTPLVKRHGEKLGGLLRDYFTVHYTPKHGSWLNQAEIEVSLLSRQCLGNAEFRT